MISRLVSPKCLWSNKMTTASSLLLHIAAQRGIVQKDRAKDAKGTEQKDTRGQSKGRKEGRAKGTHRGQSEGHKGDRARGTMGAEQRAQRQQSKGHKGDSTEEMTHRGLHLSLSCWWWPAH